MSKTRVENKNNLQVAIQDVVVASKKNTSPPPEFATGEFGEPEKFGGIRLTSKREEEKSLLDRLYKQMNDWIEHAAIVHRQHCVSNQLLPDKKNNVTRLLTNEFFFYTKKPLRLHQFEKLMQRLADLAKTYPSNLHVVLGSFAVLTPDSKVMNIVPHVECGEHPVINFAVKSNPSDIDPVYSDIRKLGVSETKTLLKNVNIAQGDRVDHLGVTIDGQFYAFSFENLFLCKTAGGLLFHSCVEICLDHQKGVAKETLDEKLKLAVNLANKGVPQEKLPLQVSHTIISNWCELKSHYIVGEVTHVDPNSSHARSKYNVSSLSTNYVAQVGFGTPANVITYPSVSCGEFVGFERDLVNYHNEVQQLIADFKGDKIALLNEIDNRFSIERSRLRTASLVSKTMHALDNSVTTLAAAVASDEFEMVNYLLSNKVSANTLTARGNPLLFLAVDNASPKMVALLLGYGADPFLLSAHGVSAQDHALLLKSAADKNKNDRSRAQQIKEILNMFDQVAKEEESKIALHQVVKNIDAHIARRSTEREWFEFFGGSKMPAEIDAANALKDVACGIRGEEALKPHMKALKESRLNEHYQAYLKAKQIKLAPNTRKNRNS